MVQEVKRIKETVESKDQEIKQLKAQLQIYQNQNNQQKTTLVQQLRVSSKIRISVYRSFFNINLIYCQIFLKPRLLRQAG